MQMQQTILVCDDDHEIVDAIEIYLSQEGYRILKAYDGYQALDILKKEDVQLIILDIMMPKMDGSRTTMKIRSISSVPIILLSARSEDADKILGLNMGADDYITKPFNPLELMARVRSQLRRYTQLGAIADELPQVYKTGGLVVDDNSRTVTMDGEEIRLTPLEYKILLYMIKNAGYVLTIDQIYQHIWKEEALRADNTVAVHIRHLREKLEIDPRNPQYLKVVWGIGYKLEKR